jgi:putative peptidoglycan lipid II flippase
LTRALTRRLPEMRFGSLWISLGKITLATAGMAAVVAVGWWLMQRMVAGRGADLIAVLVLIPLACAVYGLLLWSLKIEGREELQAMLARVRPGAGGAAP